MSFWHLLRQDGMFYFIFKCDFLVLLSLTTFLPLPFYFAGSAEGRPMRKNEWNALLSSTTKLSSELQNITIDFEEQRESMAISGKSVKENHDDDPEQQDNGTTS